MQATWGLCGAHRPPVLASGSLRSAPPALAGLFLILQRQVNPKGSGRKRPSDKERKRPDRVYRPNTWGDCLQPACLGAPAPVNSGP
jgi:hypothetical protein